MCKSQQPQNYKPNIMVAKSDPFPFARGEFFHFAMMGERMTFQPPFQFLSQFPSFWGPEFHAKA